MRFSKLAGNVLNYSFQVVVAVLVECKNLRSSVSRVALTTLGTLFQNMKSKMDSEIEKVGVTIFTFNTCFSLQQYSCKKLGTLATPSSEKMPQSRFTKWSSTGLLTKL